MLQLLARPLLLALLLISGTAIAQSDPLVTVESVIVGNAGNRADQQTGYGAIAYEYRIGKYHVTIEQYVAFLNAKAAVPPNKVIEDLWIADMADPKGKEKPGALITRAGAGTLVNPYRYEVVVSSFWGVQSGKRPVCWVSWFDAARFANWMHNGAMANSDTETGAYDLPNYMSEGIVSKNAGARWWIPTEDEWYKAAYFDPTVPAGGGYYRYATRSNTVPTLAAPPGPPNSANFNNIMSIKGNVLTPVGAYTQSPSYYGTFDQGGNLWQWTDGVYEENRIVRGGSFSHGLTPLLKTIRRDYAPGFYRDDDTGFRLAGLK